jgi:3-oxoadipate enol-lactonase
VGTRFTSSPTRLALSVAGRGPLVVFVHGMGGDRTAWHGQLEALADRFTAVSVDLRGYGDSEPSQGPLDFRRDFAADLVAVIDHFKVASAHLVGLSMGGRVARSTTLLHPQRVASLTLANTSPGFDALGPAEVEQFIASRTFRAQGDAMPAGYGVEQARAMMAPGTPEPLLRDAGRPLERLSASHYLRVLRASTEQDRGARLEDIACPVHLITSDLDRVYPAEVTLQMRNRLRNPHLTCITRAGHLSNLEQPEAFNRALRDFLLQQPPLNAAHHGGD